MRGIQSTIYTFENNPEHPLPTSVISTLPDENLVISPQKARYFDEHHKIMVQKNGLVLSWEDNEGLYEVSFDTEKLAWESYLYWCYSAVNNGKI